MDGNIGVWRFLDKENKFFIKYYILIEKGDMGLLII
jgi:hypothetical protein